MPVTHETASGRIELPFGQCDLRTDEAGLTLIATASDRPQLDKTIEVMSGHLDRFAFRENPELTWTFEGAEA